MGTREQVMSIGCAKSMGGESKEVKLVGFWVSPFVKRVEWALKLKGVDSEYIEEDIFNKTHLLLQLNPVKQKVPVLVHGEKPILESFVIIEYIDEIWKEKPLFLPGGPLERADARFWAKFAEEKILEASYNALASEGAEQEEALRLAREALEKLEEVLKVRGSKFFGGDESIGYVDLVMGWIAYMLPVFEEVGGMSVFDPQKHPAISAWKSNFLDHPVIKNSLPPKDKMLQYFHDSRMKHTTIPHGWIAID